MEKKRFLQVSIIIQGVHKVSLQLKIFLQMQLMRYLNQICFALISAYLTFFT